MKKFPDGIVPRKSTCNLKNFFLRNFGGVLHDLLPEIFKKNRIYFKCLKPGHTKPNCKSSIKCYKCKKQGDHHTALRNPNKVSDNPTEEKITCLVKNNQNILLQTANALVTDKNETQVCAIKLLLDAGSQQTFITQRVVDELKLKPLREINMEDGSFFK